MYYECKILKLVRLSQQAQLKTPRTRNNEITTMEKKQFITQYLSSNYVSIMFKGLQWNSKSISILSIS